jgi:RNA polymerase sigma-32 factor
MKVKEKTTSLDDTSQTKKVRKKSESKGNNDETKSLVRFDPLQRYLSEISQYRLLTREEEIELGKRVQEHEDMDAAYRLVTSNLRLVVKIALEFQRVWMQNLLDLIQEGNIGLMQAVKKFDPYKNVKFSYYASFWIKAYVIKFIMDNWKLVKIGTTQAQRKLFFNLRKEKERLLSLGFEAGPKLLAERLDVKESEVIEMDQRLGSWEVSLDAPIKEDSNTDHQSFIPAEQTPVDEQLADFERKELLREKLAEFRTTLPDKERFIFDRRLLADQPLTLQEIGDRYGISRERVRQIETRITNKIKVYLREEIKDIEDL